MKQLLSILLFRGLNGEAPLVYMLAVTKGHQRTLFLYKLKIYPLNFIAKCIQKSFNCFLVVMFPFLID